MKIQTQGFNLLILVFVVLFTAMGRKVANVNNKTLYSPLIGKEYKTAAELVVFKFGDSKEIMLQKYGQNVPEKNEMKNEFPYKYYGAKILGILPAGSTFKLTNITAEGGPDAAFIYYHAELISSENPSFIGKNINPSLLTNSGTNPPKFDPQYIEEIK